MKYLLITWVGVMGLTLGACGDDSSKSTDAGTVNDSGSTNHNGHDSGTDGSVDNQQNTCPNSYFSNTDCSSFEDKTGNASVVVSFGGGTLGENYSPKCLKVSKGTTVTFSGSFGVHPLRQACGPVTAITNTGTGANVDFVFDTVGDYGYYCNNHGSAADGSGMAGMIRVVE